jgi:hypothetical protein
MALPLLIVMLAEANTPVAIRETPKSATIARIHLLLKLTLATTRSSAIAFVETKGMSEYARCCQEF